VLHWGSFGRERRFGRVVARFVLPRRANLYGNTLME
jgi:hypothetical protein